MATLQQYQTHLEKFGPECLLETAATELGRDDLGQLKALVESYERTYRWQPGRGWVHRGQEVRQCEHCGLDLPKNAHKLTRYHGYCRSARERSRKAATPHRAPRGAPANGPDGAENAWP